MIKSEIVALPSAIITFLTKDTLTVAEQDLPTRAEAPSEPYEDQWESDLWAQAKDSSDWEDDPSSPHPPQLRDNQAEARATPLEDMMEQEVGQFKESLNDALSRLGGAACPRLSGNCPNDALWASSTGSLKCTTAEEVLLLLQCSEKAQAELQQAAQTGHQVSVILRKWANLHPDREFRCFIRNGQLLAMSQRDCSKYYEQLVEGREAIRALVEAFAGVALAPLASTTSYAVDVYVTTQNRVYIIDIGEYGPSMNSLLFEWDELQGMELQPGGAVIRVIEDENFVGKAPASAFGVPHEFSTMDIKIEDIMEIAQQHNNQ